MARGWAGVCLVTEELSSSQNRQGHDRGVGQTGRPVHLQDLDRTHTQVCSSAEPWSGSQGSPVSPGGHRARSRSWEKSCPWPLSDLRRTYPAAMSSWRRGRLGGDRKGWQVFAEDLEAWGFHMSSWIRRAPGQEPVGSCVLQKAPLLPALPALYPSYTCSPRLEIWG